MLKKALRQFFQNKYFFILLILGSIIWSLTMVRSGILYPFGYGFWGANGHDAIWHLALSESLAKKTLNNPVFAGEAIKNYHLGFDLLLALITQITKIPIHYLYFQILPPLFALGIGSLVYLFVLSWRGSKIEALWATAFVYFSGGFGFVITFLRNGVFTGESMFWSQQSVSTLINPPFALSLVFILLGLIFLQKYQKKQSTLYYVLCTVSFGLLIQVKAYSAILVLGGLAITTIYELFIKGSILILKVFLGALILNLTLYFIFKSDGLGNVFIFQPFWYLETMMSYTDRLGWERFYSAMTTYKMSHIWFKGLLAYLAAFIIFLIGNMGLRVTGFYFLMKEKLDQTLVFLISIVSIAVIIPMFFVQSGTPWNTIQFFYYYLFFFAILAGIAMSQIKSRFKYVIFVIFAIFSCWSTLQHYLPKMPQAKISNEEIEALTFLEKLPEGIVLTYPFDQDKAKEAIKSPPRPLYFYDSTAYVSAYSDKQVFLEDEVNLNIMGYDWKSRKNKVLAFILSPDPKTGQDFLKSNNIKYLYLVKEASPLFGELLKNGSFELGLEKIFDNKDYIIYRYGENIGGN